MRLWGIAAFAAVALLSFLAISAHGAYGAHGGYEGGGGGLRLVAAEGSAQGAQAGTAVASLATTASPPLAEVAGSKWQTTVLVSGTPGSCPVAATDYSLETTSPELALKPVSVTKAAGQVSPAPASCEVTLIFDDTRLRQVPAQATLVLDGSSALALTISRQVSLFYYVGIPAIFGAVMAVMLLGWCLGRVRVYDRRGAREPVFSRSWPFGGGFWRHQVRASGAWTLNDSWVTNIAAVVAVAGTVIGLVPATDTLFRGVALDRFEILNAVAAGIVVAAPLVVAIRYARWVRKNPGVTADACLQLPVASLEVSVAELPSGAEVERPGNGGRITLAAGALVTVDAGTAAVVPERGTIPLTPTPAVRLAAGTKVTLPRHTAICGQDGRAQRLWAAASAVLAGACDVTMAAPVTVKARSWALLALPAGPPALAVTLRTGTSLAMPGGKTITLRNDTQATLASGAAATLCPVTPVPLEGLPIAFRDKTGARLPDGAIDEGEDPAIVIPRGTSAVLRGRAGATSPLDEILYGPSTTVWLPAGASITASAGTSVSTVGPGGPGGPGVQRAQVAPGHGIQVPPGTTVSIRARRLRLPGGSDILFEGDAILAISGAAGTLTLPAGDVEAGHDDPGTDMLLPLPAQLVTPGGAKITANGVAEILPPASTQVTTPYRKSFVLSPQRSWLRCPSGDALAGTMGMIILAAVVTMFGVGAELGLALVLAVGLSQASVIGDLAAWIVLATITLFTLAYSVTAIATLADPEPGSSMSTTAGTSFTL